MACCRRRLLLGLFVVWAGGSIAVAQRGAQDGEWRHIGGGHGAAKYSPLSQIDSENFAQLEVAWRWESAGKRVEELSPYPREYFRATPLMIKGRVYVPTELGQVAALDAGSGEELWVYDPESYERGKPGMYWRYTRSLEYWSDGVEERVFIATMGRQLVSVDIATGLPDPRFGEDGIVDLSRDLGREDFPVGNISHGAPVIVFRDRVIVGSKIFDMTLRRSSPPGHIRAYDVRTGELSWRFHTIPQEGELFTETWENDSWRGMGNTNAWAPMSADEELGYVYIATSTPTNDYWGGERHGDNLFAESLLCLDAATGKRVWHFQTVHHGIWDYDIASAPNLVDVVVDGRLRKAVAQVSKTAFTYVFDRATGEPLWPIEERPVEASTVPGEKLALTQPFPTKPPAFDRVGVSVDDLIDFTPELESEARDIGEKFKLGPIFMPLILAGEGGKLGTVVVPGAGGGANHPGASLDPDTGLLYVQSMTRATGMALIEPDPVRSDWKYMLDRVTVEGPRGLPLFKPPFGRITAIDLRIGEHAWQVPLGDGPTRHPAIKHLGLGPLGSKEVGNQGGLLVTKTLLIAFAPKYGENGELVPGSVAQAYDKASGRLLAEFDVDISFYGAPITYLHRGRQYIVAAGGGTNDRRAPDWEAREAALVAFALPELPP